MSDELRDALIRVAFAAPETREDLIPLLTQKVATPKGFINLDDGRRRTDRDVTMFVADTASWWFMQREKKVFVKDDEGRFTDAAAKKAGYRNRIHALKSIGEDRIHEESGYAMEGEDWKGSRKLQLLSSLYGKANLRIDPITSPTSGASGWRITF